MPSSPGLVKTMVEWFDWDNARGIVEYGPGTGVFTEGIVNRLHPDAKFFAIERSADLAELTRKRCPGVDVHEESADDVVRLCQDAGIDQVDAIICGLPWASFPESLQRSILDATLDVLRPGGQFATFAYWQGVVLPAGIRFSKKLRESFSEVHRSPTVWRNVPPAFVYRCTK
ncbi:MAG: class I SAM-dependent methyltransferase [Rhodopirellula sp. JB044]|uniref:class I SAM-dependent methyltransferase n=1 Tax=Rhodopirellula sp. JB044 TaxID=3342844 RepID=UPI00370A1E87